MAQYVWTETEYYSLIIKVRTIKTILDSKETKANIISLRITALELHTFTGNACDLQLHFVKIKQIMQPLHPRTPKNYHVHTAAFIELSWMSYMPTLQEIKTFLPESSHHFFHRILENRFD